MRACRAALLVTVIGGSLSVAGCGRREAPPAPPSAPEPVSPPPSPPSPVPAIDAAASQDAAPAAVTEPAAPAAVTEPAAPAKGRHRAAESAEGGGTGHGAIAKLKVTGSVARADVERVLRAAVPKLQACRAANGAGKGALDLEVTFGERGWVSLAEVKRSTVTGGDPQMCVVTELRALRFPKPSDGKDATASFALQFK